jgi:general secretion pathway protein F
MPLYSYRAVSPAGDVSSGQLEAANESEIVDRLRDQGLLPMQIAQALGAASMGERASKPPRASWFAPKRVTRDNVLGITRELATLLRAGLPLDRALELLITLAPSLPVAPST